MELKRCEQWEQLHKFIAVEIEKNAYSADELIELSDKGDCESYHIAVGKKINYKIMVCERCGVVVSL